MKNMTRVLRDVEPKPKSLAMSKHISQSIRMARNRRPVPAVTIFQGYMFASHNPT
jgi:hypothetical protein